MNQRTKLAMIGYLSVCLGLLACVPYGQAKKALMAEKAHLSTLDRQKYPSVVVGMGCFWGAQKRMNALQGVVDSEVGYAGGADPAPSYRSVLQQEDVQNGAVNHAEVVKVWYDPQVVSLEGVLAQFWENHDPTQGNRQGNDIGSNYRSSIYVNHAGELTIAQSSRDYYQVDLAKAGHRSAITTEIALVKNYASAETYHQDYLVKNPQGYCGHGGLDIAYSHQKTHQKMHQKMHQNTQQNQNAKTADSHIIIKDSWQGVSLNNSIQLVSFEADDCGYCKQFQREVAFTWSAKIPLHSTYAKVPPVGWKISQTLFATPTIVLFKNQQEVARHTGYRGQAAFTTWLQAQGIALNP